MSRVSLRLFVPLLLSAGLMAIAEEPKTPVKLAGVVPPDATAFVSLDVAKVWEHKSFGTVREARGKVEFTWAVQSLFGVAPDAMERLTVFWHPAGKGEPFALITGRKNLDAKKIAKLLARPDARTKEKDLGKVVSAPGSEFPYLLQLDARTVLLAPAGADPAKLESLAGMKGRLAAAIDSAGNHALTVAIDVESIAALPLPVGGPLLQAETAVLTADITEKDEAAAELRLAFAEEVQAAKAAPFLKTKLDELAGWAGAQEKKSSERGQQGTGYPAPLFEWIGKTLKTAKVKADGKVATAAATLKLEQGFGALMTAIPDAALAPRGSTAGENNMRQIVLGMMNYSDANGKMPANTYDKDGKAILSWRVLLLPYIEQDALYRQFKLDEPWDSDNNKRWSEVAIKVFQVPGRPAPKPNETYFRGFIGPKDVKAEHRPWLVDDPKAKTNFPASFSDGTSNTFLVVEASEAVPWAKPDDLPYDGVLALPKMGGPGGSYIAGFADGSVRTFRRNQIDEKNLRNLISIADGNPVNFPDR